MSNPFSHTVKIVLATLSGAFPLAGCGDVHTLQNRLQLNQEQAAQTRDILEEYVARQNQLLDAIVHHRPAAPLFPEPPEFQADAAGKPTLADINRLLQEVKAAMTATFKASDDFTLKRLADFLTAEQLGRFPGIAREIRRSKIKRSLSMRRRAGGDRHE